MREQRRRNIQSDTIVLDSNEVHFCTTDKLFKTIYPRKVSTDRV